MFKVNQSQIAKGKRKKIEKLTLIKINPPKSRLK